MSVDEYCVETPMYISFLNEADCLSYRKLQRSLSTFSYRSPRNQKESDFDSGFLEIKRFALRGDSNDWKRCLVCGVCWLESGIAINIKQLQCLIRKCKSSINTTMRKLGYSLSASRGDVNDELVAYLPSIQGNTAELRKWSVRKPPVSKFDHISCSDVISKPPPPSEPFVSPFDPTNYNCQSEFALSPFSDSNSYWLDGVPQEFSFE